MTNFPHNLSILRRRAGYTQESLAEVLGVSRQAVSKWESGQTLPEASTLLTLADLLGCSLDQLMREELSEDVSNDMGAVADEDEDGRFALFVEYDKHMDRFSIQIASGVLLVLLGVAALLWCNVFWGESGLIVLPLLLCVAVAVFLFIWGGTAHDDFQKANPVLPDFYAPEAVEHFRRMFRVGMAVAVAAILVDVALLVALAVFFENNEQMSTAAVAVFLTVLSIAVGSLTFLGIQHSKYNISEYIQEAARKDTPDSPQSRLSGSIMMLATAIFLVAGFLFGAWHPAWVVFPVGGILCGVVGNTQKK